LILSYEVDLPVPIEIADSHTFWKGVGRKGDLAGIDEQRALHTQRPIDGQCCD